LNDPRVSLPDDATTIVFAWSGNARARIAELIVQRWPGGLLNLNKLEARISWHGECSLREYLAVGSEIEMPAEIRYRLAAILRCQRSFLKDGEPFHRDLEAELEQDDPPPPPLPPPPKYHVVKKRLKSGAVKEYTYEKQPRKMGIRTEEFWQNYLKDWEQHR
jgi:hypothetical protein